MGDKQLIEEGLEKIVSEVRGRAGYLFDKSFARLTKDIVGSPYYKVCRKNKKDFIRVYVPTRSGNMSYIDMTPRIRTYTCKPRPTRVVKTDIVLSWINLDDLYIEVFISDECSKNWMDSVEEIDSDVAGYIINKINSFREYVERHKNDEPDTTPPHKADAAPDHTMRGMSDFNTVCLLMSGGINHPFKISDKLLKDVKRYNPDIRVEDLVYDDTEECICYNESDTTVVKFSYINGLLTRRIEHITTGTLLKSTTYYDSVAYDTYSDADVSIVKVFDKILYIIEVNYDDSKIIYRCAPVSGRKTKDVVVKSKTLTEDELFEIHAYVEGDGNSTWVDNIYYSNELVEEVLFN